LNSVSQARIIAAGPRVWYPAMERGRCDGAIEGAPSGTGSAASATDQTTEDGPETVPLKQSLAELSRALESLLHQLHEIGRMDAAAASAARPFAPESPPAAAPGAPSLASVEGILALSSADRAEGDVFGLALERLAQFLDADRAMVLLADRQRGRLVPRAGRGFRREDPSEIALAPGEGLIGRAFLEQRPVHYSKRGEEPISDPFVARYPVGEAVAVPIRVSGDAAGALYVGRRAAGDAFSVEQTLVLLLVADQLGAALAHDRLVERVGDHVARLGQLGGFSEKALVGHDLSAVLVAACETARRLVRVPWAALWIREEEGTLSLGAASGVPSSTAHDWRPDLRTGLAAELFSSREQVRCADLAAEPAVDEPVLRAAGVRGCLILPLRVASTIAGALYLADTERRDFSADEVEAAQVLASVAGLAIENDRLYRDVHRALDHLKAAQERLIQTEKTRALGEMAGGIAHEFNNILAIILGKTQLLVGRLSEDRLRDGLGVIEEAAWRAGCGSRCSPISTAWRRYTVMRPRSARR
jgi:GAF domain-containing protein